MTTNIQSIATNCVAFQPSILNRLGQVSAAVMETAKKIISIANNYYLRASFVGSIALHTAWEATKTYASDVSSKVHAIASAIFGFAKTLSNRTIEYSQKVASFAAKHFAKAPQHAAAIWSHVRSGAVQGFQMSRTFFATHQKESMIVGGAVAIGLTAFYAISHFRAAHNQEIDPRSI